jgi:predicted nucleic acid-binding protein
VTPVVPDASVAVAWYVEEPESTRAAQLQSGSVPLMAPTFLQVEVANVMVMHMRRRKPIPLDYPEAALRELRSGGIAWTPDSLLIDSAAAIARRHLHPVYDCLYLALARREEAMLATFDRRLAALAEALAIPLWSPDDVQETP